jgi:hypothetical protein
MLDRDFRDTGAGWPVRRDRSGQVLDTLGSMLPATTQVLIVHDRSLDQIGWTPEDRLGLQPTWTLVSRPGCWQ